MQYSYIISYDRAKLQPLYDYMVDFNSPGYNVCAHTQVFVYGNCVGTIIQGINYPRIL